MKRQCALVLVLSVIVVWTVGCGAEAPVSDSGIDDPAIREGINSGKVLDPNQSPDGQRRFEDPDQPVPAGDPNAGSDAGGHGSSKFEKPKEEQSKDSP